MAGVYGTRVDASLANPLDYLRNKSGRIWHCRLAQADVRGARFYAYSLAGPAPQGRYDWHCFDPEKILLDPYAKSVFFPQPSIGQRRRTREQTLARHRWACSPGPATCVMINASDGDATFQIQEGRPGEWRQAFDTELVSPDDFHEPADGPVVGALCYVVRSRSVVGLVRSHWHCDTQIPTRTQSFSSIHFVA